MSNDILPKHSTPSSLHATDMQGKPLSVISLYWYALAVVVLILDLWSKSYFSSTFYLGEVREVIPSFSFTLRHNTGAAFSFLADAGGWQRWFFGVIAAVVSVVLVVWIAILRGTSKWEACALALILGGALGNLYDRVTLGYVVDFILVYYRDSYFPAFNIADSAITAGAVMMIADAFLPKRQASAKTVAEPKEK